MVFPDHVCLRAERQGTDPTERLYTLRVRAQDESGNLSEGEVLISVPHDQGGQDCPRLVGQEFVDDDSDPRCTPEGGTSAAPSLEEEAADTLRGGCSLAPAGKGTLGSFFSFLLLLALVWTTKSQGKGRRRLSFASHLRGGPPLPLRARPRL